MSREELTDKMVTDVMEDFDFETDEQCRELCRVVEKWNGHDDGRIRIDCGIHSEYTGNYKLWEALGAYAMEAGLQMQLHLAQTEEEAESCLDRTGLSQTELLGGHRLFSVPATISGCVAMTDEDRKYLGKKGASAVATPVADGKAGQAIYHNADAGKSPGHDTTRCQKNADSEGGDRHTT